MAQFHDEAGNIWEIDPNGGPPRFVSGPSTPSTGPSMTTLTGPKVDKPHVVESNVDYIINPNGSATPRPGGPKDPNTKSDSLGDYTKTGDAFLATVPANLRNLIKMYASNKLTPPTRPSDKVQLILDAAAQYDPTYDPALSTNRAKAIKDFTGHGPDALVVGSVNRLASHINDMFDASEKMGGPNLGFSPLNRLVASTQQAFDPVNAAKYDAAKPFVASELDKIAKGSGGTTTVQGITEALSTLERARSLDERRAAFGQLAGIVHGALDPIQQRWNSAYGGDKAPPMWLSPDAAKVFTKLDPNRSDTYNGEAWRGLPGLKGDGTPGQATGLGPPPGGTPPSSPLGGNGTPPIINSGGPTQALATGETRNQYNPQASKTLDGFIRQGMSAEHVNAWAKQNGYAPVDPSTYAQTVSYAKVHPDYNKLLGEVTTAQPNSMMNRAMASPLATAVTQFGNATSGGFLDEIGGAATSLINGKTMSENIAAANANKQAQAALNPGSAMIGNIGGGAAAMLGGGAALKGLGMGKSALAWAASNPKLAALIGDTAYGGIYGSGENNDNRAGGAGMGMLAGAGGSVLGQGVAQGLGKVATGIVNPAVDLLRAKGIPLTVGEIMGSGAKKLQDAMTSVPGVGGMIERRYADGRAAMNNAAFNDAGAITGTPINAIGPDGLRNLATAKTAAYSNALDPISLDLNSPSFVQDMGATLNRARALPVTDNAQGHALDALTNYVGKTADKSEGQMSGRDFQAAYQGLSREAKPNPNKAFSYDVGQTLQQGKNDLAGALQDQHPGAFGQFVDANNLNRHLSVLQDAVQRAQNQIGDNGVPMFTPAQLSAAGSANERTYGSRLSAAMGDKPFGELAAAAQQVMSSKLPDSGTPLRQFAQKALIGGGLLGATGGAGYGTDGTSGALEAVSIPMLAATLMGTRLGQAKLTAMLLNRPALLRNAGQGLIDNSNVAGALGAGYGISRLPGQ